MSLCIMQASWLFFKVIFYMCVVLKARNMQTDIDQFQNFWKKHLKYVWQIKELSINYHGFCSYLVHSDF